MSDVQGHSESEGREVKVRAGSGEGITYLDAGASTPMTGIMRHSSHMLTRLITAVPDLHGGRGLSLIEYLVSM